MYATRRWASKGEQARGWYKLYRSIDLLSEKTLRCRYHCEETHAAVATVLLLLSRPCVAVVSVGAAAAAAAAAADAAGAALLCGLLGCI